MKMEKKANLIEDSVLTGHGIYKMFGGLQALQNIDFRVPRGSIFAVIGPNGAGKTTLFNLISGVYKDYQGEIYFNNERISQQSSHIIAKKGIARTFQNVRLFRNLSALENVMIGCHGWFCPKFFRTIFGIRTVKKEERIIREWSLEKLRFLKLEDKADHPVESLPLGSQKLVEIARALAAKPKLLLLDEPAAGLNESEMDHLKESIFKIKKEGTTQIIVEHNMNFIMSISDWIMVLNFGVKIAEGIPKEIVNNDRVIKAYLGEVEKFV